MGASIITGFTGTRHITPEMDGAVYRGIIGDESYILAEGDQCEGSMPSINQFTVKSGVVSMQGRQIYITQETLPIDTCPTGYKRIDLICVRFEHDTTSLVDQASLIVIKGVEVDSANDPVEPAHNEGVIKDGATVVDFVLYKLTFDSATVEIEKSATTLSNIHVSKEVKAKWSSLTNTDGSINDALEYLANEQWGNKTRINPSQMSRVGCNGTINGYIDYKIDATKKKVWLAGRIYITGFSRTGANPGVFLSDIGLDATSDAAVGYRGESPVELVTFNAASGRLSTLESFSNASGTRLTLMVPPSVFYYD